MINSVVSAHQALTFWRWKTENELSKMNGKNKRNALIVGLEKISAHSIGQLQKFPTNSRIRSLVGFAFISVFLKSYKGTP